MDEGRIHVLRACSRQVLCRAELSQQVQATQEAATPMEAPDAHMHRVHRLSASTHDAKENVASLNQAAR